MQNSFTLDCIKAAAVLIAIITGVCLLAAAVIDVIDMPLVSISNSTGKCVKVELADGRPGSCDALPERYETIIVK